MKESSPTDAENKPNVNSWLIDNIGIVKFYFLAMILFGSFFVIYSSFIVESDIFGSYLELTAHLASQTFNFLFNESSHVIRSNLMLDTEIRVDTWAYVVVAQGCDASTVFATLLATVLAWPSPIWKRLIVAVIGVGVMFGLNILRIALVLLTDVYQPMLFELMHVWILPTLLVLGALVYFFIWTIISKRHPSEWN